MVFYFACKIKEKRSEKRTFAHRIREIFLYIAGKCKIYMTKQRFCHLEKAKISLISLMLI